MSRPSAGGGAAVGASCRPGAAAGPDRFGSARLVLLGEASHGTREPPTTGGHLRERAGRAERHERNNDPHSVEQLATLDEGGASAVSAVPLALGYCHTRLAVGREYSWMRNRFAAACAALDAEMTTAADGRLAVRWH